MGEGRSGPLSWGQLVIWLEFEGLPPGQRHQLNEQRWLAVPPDAGVRHVEAAVAALVERHEILRTTVGVDRHGDPFQTVHAPAPVPVETIAIDGEPDEQALLDGPLAHLTRRPFHLERDRPIRVALATEAGRPRRLLLVVHHIAIDAWSFRILGREFSELASAAAAGRAPALPPVTHQMLDEVAFQRSPAGVRTSAAALEYWERQFTSMPHRSFQPDGGRAGGVRRRYLLESPAVLAATRQLARRQDASLPNVVLAAFAMVLSRYTGLGSCTAMTVSANRAARRTWTTVGTFPQPALASIDLTGDPSFAEVVRRTSSASVKAYRHACYDHAAMRAQEARSSLARGVSFDWQVVFSSRLSEPEPDQADAPGPAGTADAAVPPGALLDRTRLSWESMSDCGLAGPGVVLVVGHEEPAATVQLTANPAVVPGNDPEALLWSIEALIVRAAEHPDLRLAEIGDLVRVEAPRRPAGWRLVDGCWINLDDVRQVLEGHPEVGAARVFVEETGSLVACVAARDGVGPGELRRFVLARLRERPSVMAPHRFVVCAQAPAEREDVAAWLRQRPLDSGDGRAAAFVPPATPEEAALCDALSRTHELERVSTAEGYVSQGGQIQRVPAVQRRLLAAGFVGVALEDFCGTCTIGQLAARLFRLPAGGVEALLASASGQEAG